MSNVTGFDDGTAFTVLVVDDAPENLAVIGGILQPFFRVRVAKTGQRALGTAASESPPDLILLDVMMPQMDGYAVLAALQDNPDTRTIPVIFVTAMDADKDVERGLTLGAVDYVTKPVSPEVLLARVRVHLALAHAKRQLRAQNEDLQQVAEAADADLNVFATVVNSPRYGDAFSREVAAAILATRATRRRHIEALLRLVKDKGYDGIDLDWEELTAADRDKFSLFVEELAAALHAEERFLSVAVYPKTSEPGRWPSQRAMDYKRLGAAVDEFKLMTYAYSGPWSGPGPQSPYTWLDQVLTFAESRVPAKKIYMGVPFFGYSWRGGGARAMTGREVARLPKRFFKGSARDDASGELILRFTDDYGVEHHAYVPDATAIAKKIAFLRREHPRIGGIAIWVMGQEGKGFWTAVAEGLQKP
jgi:spore germination protein YaaH